ANTQSNTSQLDTRPSTRASSSSSHVAQPASPNPRYPRIRPAGPPLTAPDHLPPPPGAPHPGLPEAPPGHPATGDRRQPIGDGHGEAEADQRGQVGAQPAQVGSLRRLVMAPLHGQGITEVEIGRAAG